MMALMSIEPLYQMRQISANNDDVSLTVRGMSQINFSDDGNVSVGGADSIS